MSQPFFPGDLASITSKKKTFSACCSSFATEVSRPVLVISEAAVRECGEWCVGELLECERDRQIDSYASRAGHLDQRGCEQFHDKFGIGRVPGSPLRQQIASGPVSLVSALGAQDQESGDAPTPKVPVKQHRLIDLSRCRITCWAWTHSPIARMAKGGRCTATNKNAELHLDPRRGLAPPAIMWQNR